MNTSQDSPEHSPEQPSGHAAPPPLPHPDSARFFQWIRGLGIRRGPNRWMGGVCSGLADKWGIDPVIVRGLAVVLTLFFGIGLLAYGVAWALLPEPDGRIHVQEVGRGHWSAGMTGAAAATLLGLGGSGGGTFQDSNSGWFFWPIIWIGGIVWAIYWFSYRGKGERGSNASQPWYGHTWQSSATPQTQPQPTDVYARTFTPRADEYVKRQGQQATKPPTKKTPRLGFASSLLVLGLAAVVVAALLLLNASNVIDLGTHPRAIIVAAAAIVAGVGIVVAGIAGRTAGGLGTFAVIALVVAGALSLPQPNIASFSNADWSPATISAAHTGRTVLMGNGTIDLTGIVPAGNRAAGNGAAKPGGDSPLTENVRIPLSLVASNVTILVPENIPVSVKSELAAAAVTVDGKTTGSGLVKDTTSNINLDATGYGLAITLEGVASNIEIHVVPTP